MIEETQREPNSSFSKKLPQLQLAIDSTSLGEAKLCPTRYKYVIIDGYEPSGVNVHYRYGIEFGASTEVWDRGLVAGLDHETATKEAIRYALASTWDNELNRPWVSGDETKNRETLIQAVIDYADNYKEDTLKTLKLPDGTAAAELSFNFEIPGMDETITGERFVFCGYLDRVVSWQDRIYITDRKTTGKPLNRAYFARYSPDNQMSLYTLAGKIIFPTGDVSGVIIDAVQVTKTGTNFQRGIIERTESQLDEWLRDAIYYIGLMELWATTGEYPQNDKACLAGTTLVSVTRGTNAGRKLSIKKLYEIFHAKPAANYEQKRKYRPENPNRKRAPYSKYGFDTYILSDVGGTIENNLVLDIIHKGKKPVYYIGTSAGTATRATGDHEFKTANGTWKKVEDLRVGDEMAFWPSRRKLSGKTSVENHDSQRSFVVNLPYYEGGGWQKEQNGRTVICQRKSRLVIEADMNNMDYDFFIAALRNPDMCRKFQYLSADIEIHHKNKNVADDRLSNLEALPMLAHKEQHDMREHVNKLDIVTIASIYLQSETDVYDISMQSPHNNFVADGLIAHNCGSTYLDPKTGELSYGCPFRPVCGSDPSIRPDLLRLGYRRRTWDPLKIRQAKSNKTELQKCP